MPRRRRRSTSPWTPRSRSRSGSRSRSRGRQRARAPPPPPDPPALASAKSLLALSAHLLKELGADVFAIVAALSTLVLPWRLGWVSVALREKEHAKRRDIAIDAAFRGVFDIFYASLWPLVQLSWRRSDYKQLVAVQVNGRQSIPAWWWPTGRVAGTLVADVMFAVPYLVARASWRAPILQHRLQAAVPCDSLFHDSRDPDHIVGVVGPVLIPVAVLWVGLLGDFAPFAAAKDWRGLFFVAAAMQWFFALLTVCASPPRSYGRRTRPHHSWHTIAYLVASEVVKDAAYQLRSLLAVVVDLPRLPEYARRLRSAMRVDIHDVPRLPDYARHLQRVIHADTVETRAVKFRDEAEWLAGRVGDDFGGAIMVAVVVCTVYRVRELWGCVECRRRSGTNVFGNLARRWDVHCAAVATEVFKDAAHVPVLAPLVLAPWRLWDTYCLCRHAYGAEQRREIVRQQGLLAVFDLLTMAIMLVIVVTLIRLPSLVSALRARKSGEALRQTVFRHMRQEFKVEFKMMERSNPFDTSEVVPDDDDDSSVPTAAVHALDVTNVNSWDGQGDGDDDDDDDDDQGVTVVPPMRRTRGRSRTRGTTTRRSRRRRTTPSRGAENDSDVEEVDTPAPRRARRGRSATRRGRSATRSTRSRRRATTPARTNEDETEEEEEEEEEAAVGVRHDGMAVEDMMICITGSLSVVRREAERRIRAAGAGVASTLTSRVTHLVVAGTGRNSGKYRAAVRKGDVQFLSEAQLWGMLET